MKGRYRKRPVVIEATQWFKNGDHPLDNTTRDGTTPNGQHWEGEAVRYYRSPHIDGNVVCRQCGLAMHNHGWIDTLEGGHIVCPGDWIITGINGEQYPCKPDIFEATYELVTPDGGVGDAERQSAGERGVTRGPISDTTN